MKKIVKWIILFSAVSSLTLAGCGSSKSPSGSDSSAGSAAASAASSGQSAASAVSESAGSSAASVSDSASSSETASVSEEEKEADAAASESTVIPTPEETPFPEVTEEPEEDALAETPAPEDESNIQEDLGVSLTEIAESVHTGEAGSSLKSTAAAADVLDFAMRTELTTEQIRTQTERYMAALPEEQQMEFPDQVMYTGEAIHTLKDGNGQAMLEDAGVTDSGYPWTEEAYQKADAILQGAGI